MVKVNMGEANGPCIILDLLAFYPAEEPPPAAPAATSLPPMAPMPIPQGFPGPAFFPNGQFPPHMMIPHHLSNTTMALSRQPAATPTQVNPAQLHNQSSPALPAPPSTTGFSGTYQGDTPGLDKKRKPSLELRPSDQKRRKGENGLPTPPAAGTSTVNPHDVIDLTFEDSVP
jgi:hypothetical protein